jgi:hypothetical protein
MSNTADELQAIHRLDIRLTALEVATDQREEASEARHKALTDLLNQRHDALMSMLTERESHRASELNRIWVILGTVATVVGGALVKYLLGGHP